MIKVNGKPLHLIEPSTLRYKVGSVTKWPPKVNSLFFVAWRAAPFAWTREIHGCRHQGASEGWWSRFANLWLVYFDFCKFAFDFHFCSAIRQAISKSLIAYYQKCECHVVSVLKDASIFLPQLQSVILKLVYNGGRENWLYLWVLALDKL